MEVLKFNNFFKNAQEVSVYDNYTKIVVPDRSDYYGKHGPNIYYFDNEDLKIVKDLQLISDCVALIAVYLDKNNISRSRRLAFVLLGADSHRYRIFFRNGDKKDYRKNNLYLKEKGTRATYTAFEFIEKRDKEIQRRKDCLQYIKEDSFLDNTLKPLYSRNKIQAPVTENKYTHKQNIPTIEIQEPSNFEDLASNEFLKALRGDLFAYKSALNKLKGAALLYGFSQVTE